MQWKITMLLPVAFATFMAPLVYSAPSDILPIDYLTVTIEDSINIEDVNPESEGGTGDIQVSSTASISLPPELKKVCSCESRGNPYSEPMQFYADGSVVLGHINPKDIGLCQINSDYWLSTANQLNYDLYTVKGNTLMANYLYEKYGLAPWSASKKCWAPALNS